jgi:hypothetical protein
MKLIDNMGKEIGSYNLNDFSGDVNRIPLTGLSDGLYFLNIVSEYHVFTKKIRIQK